METRRQGQRPCPTAERQTRAASHFSKSNLIADSDEFDGLHLMGAKYLPTIKDLKASQRFQAIQKQKQKPLSKKPSSQTATEPPKKP